MDVSSVKERFLYDTILIIHNINIHINFYFRNHAVSPLHQLLLTLRFYATGTFQVAIGDLGGIHKSTMCRIVKRVTEAIASLCPQYINFPTSNQSLRHTKQKFYNIASFPRVVGAIDCTHVKILSPGITLKVIDQFIVFTSYLYL